MENLDSGFIYICSNPSFIPGLIKIGKTEKDARKRINELSDHAGIPEDFVTEIYWHMENYHKNEILIHNSLKNYKFNKLKPFNEFFKISILDAANIINELCKKDIKANGIQTNDVTAYCAGLVRQDPYLFTYNRGNVAKYLRERTSEAPKKTLPKSEPKK